MTPEQVNAANSALEATASTKGYVASIDRSQYQGEEYASTSARIIGSFDARGMRDIVGNGPEGAQLRRTDPLSGRSYDDIANPGNNQFGANESLGRGRFAPFLEDGYTVNLDGVDSKNRGDEVTAAVCQRLRRLRSANGVVHAGLWSYSGRASRAGGRGWHGSLLIDGQEIAVTDEIALNEEAEKLFAANGMYTGKCCAHTPCRRGQGARRPPLLRGTRRTPARSGRGVGPVSSGCLRPWTSEQPPNTRRSRHTQTI